MKAVYTRPSTWYKCPLLVRTPNLLLETNRGAGNRGGASLFCRGADLVTAGGDGFRGDGHQVRDAPLRIRRREFHGDFLQSLSVLHKFDFHRGFRGDRNVGVDREKQ